MPTTEPGDIPSRMRLRSSSFTARHACPGLPAALAGLVLLCLALLPRAGATSVVPPTFPELVAESEMILRGVVTAIRTEEFDAPEGRGIRTLVTLRVERALKGDPGPSLTVSILGGRVGRRSLRIEGVPRFAEGDRQIVFLAGNGQVFCPLIGLGHGRYPIRTDSVTGREFVARDNGRPLQSVDEVILPLALPAAVRLGTAPAAGLGVAEFESRISALVSNPALRGREP